MSPICGVLDRNGADVSKQMRTMMRSLGKKEHAGAWLIANGIPKQWQEGSETKTNMLIGQISFAAREQPLEHPHVECRNNLSVVYEGNLYNQEELRANIRLNHRLAVDCAAEIVAHLIEDNFKNDLTTALRLVATELDGAYCLVACDRHKVVIMRDYTGLRPLFYAENDDLIAFASRKTALWEVGLRNVKPLRAGMLVTFNKDGISKAQTLEKMGIESVITDPTLAVDRYCTLIERAVEKRLRNLKKVGVLLSGGVDSCLITKLVSKHAVKRGIKVKAYTAGISGTDDIEYSKRFAQMLKLDHKVKIISRDEIEDYISKVAIVVEERDMVQIEAGVGIYAALEMASQDGTNTIFSGQGPDELWGGYSWYPHVIARDSYEGFQHRMWDDWMRGDIETFDRENKIALAHGVEQIFPYCDTEVIKLAMSVSPCLKVTSAEDNIGKHPHREAARRFGVPKEFAYRGKSAAQHGTGVHDCLDTIARKYSFTPDLVNRIGYRSELVNDEKLASSTRYGYQYGEKELWEAPEHIQFFLDALAYKCDLLNHSDRIKIEKFLNRANNQLAVFGVVLLDSYTI